NIKELWESYLPNLIYYSLATESAYFRSNDIGGLDTPLINIFNPGRFASLGVSGYSPDSIDENIRLVTDKIIYDIYINFSSAFNISNLDKGFYYRGRSFPIPPFEEYPYYVNVEFSPEMIDFIVDRLVCFGVHRSFADKVADYVREKIYDTDEELRSSSWLFFTSGYNPPPNIENLILYTNVNKFEYASLWSGKSSHFKLDLNASNFDFNKKNDEVDSIGAISLASKAVNEFAPAHAIPMIDLILSSTDKVESEEYNLPIITLNDTELLDKNKIQSNYQASALHLNTYKRSTGTGNVFDRNQLDFVNSTAYTNAVSLNSVPRNSIRRRNYDKLLPKNGYYDRTGFNMPTSFDMSSSLSGIPLGFIPSSLKFESITDYNNLPSIYSICENLKSDKSYYGYSVSNTVRCRGHLPISSFSSNDYYTDRSQLPDIIQTMHRIGEEKKIYPLSKQVSGTPKVQFLWKNVYRSFVNLVTEVEKTSFPTSFNDYSNFKFGLSLHNLYKIYTTHFNRHTLSEYILDLDGNNFTSHVYGPLVYNHDFDYVSNLYITSSLEVSNTLLDRDSLFSPVAPLFTTTYSQQGIIPGTNEYVNSSIVSGLDFIMASSPISDHFSVFKIPLKEKVFGASEYMYDRTFIKMSFGNMFSKRLRLNVCYDKIPTSDGYPLAKNFLLPDHEFKFSINGLVSTNNGRRLGGGGVGIVIRTKTENGKAWFFGSDGYWHQEVFQSNGFNNTAQIYRNYMFTYNQNDLDRNISDPQTPSPIRLQCIELTQNAEPYVTPLITFREEDFFNFEINFNTFNSYCSKYSRDYELKYNHQNVHSKDQEYFIDIFSLFNTLGSGDDERFLLLDKVGIVDKTMYEMASVISSDDNECPENKVYLEEKDLRNIFKFWNDISGKNSALGLASRVSSETSSVLLANGGSRLDYKLSVDWLQAGTSTKYTTLGNILNTFIAPV
ncbi:MAG: hypothetical protein RL348_113, partial [Bacteroidota bacterium]